MGISELGLIIVIIVAILLIGLILKPSVDDPWSETTLKKELAKRLGINDDKLNQMPIEQLGSEFDSATRKWVKLSASKFETTLTIRWKSGDVTKVTKELPRSDLPSKTREHFLRTTDNEFEAMFRPKFLNNKD